MNIFPDIKLHEPDAIIVNQALSQPAVKKYFHMLAYNIGRDIATGAKAPDQSAEDYLMIEAGMKGQLAVLDTLLGIEAVDIPKTEQ